MTKNNHGFTLIELVITLAVVSILLLTGIPMISKMTDNNRLVSQINSISGSLSLARSESIKRGTTVTVCGSTDAETCDTSNWENGWIIFSDVNSNAVLESTTDSKLGVISAFNGPSILRLSQSDLATRIQYKPNGALRNQVTPDATNSDEATFTLCEKASGGDVKRAKAINISKLGRVSRAEDTDTTADNTVNDITGADVSCPN